ncbi:MAG: type 3 dihydrofolate reductase [Thiogranum sp.]
MRIALIVAMAENRVIGRNNQLPWRIPADLRHFKTLTMGKPIIMGRKTHESIGRPLPGRHNIVISADSLFQAEGCQVVHSIEQALDAAGNCEEAMIIGGANLYRQTFKNAERLYLTLVKAEPEGDTWFPEIEWQQWREIERDPHKADESNEYDYDFVILDRAR